MSKLLYTYTSGGDPTKTIEKSNANSYSLVFDKDRKSIFAQGQEFGVTPINVHEDYGKTKVYENVVAAANDANNGRFYFLNVNLTTTDYFETWYVHYKIKVTTTPPANPSSAQSLYARYTSGEYDVYISGSGSTMLSQAFNEYFSTSYRPIYYHTILRYDAESKYTNYKATQPIKIGASLESAYGQTTYPRKFEITILDYHNCTVDFTNSIEIHKNVANSTYYGAALADATTQGLGESGDNVTYNAYSFWYYSPRKAGGLGLINATLAVQLIDGTWTSITNKSGNNNNKTCLTQGFIPNNIMYYGGTTKAVGEWNYTSATSGQFFPSVLSLALYTFTNEASTVPYFEATGYDGSVYLVGTIHDDGLFYLDTTKWWSVTPPTTEDGKYYIYIGKIYNTSSTGSVSLEFENPIYYYKDGQIWQRSEGNDQVRFDDIWGELTTT